jgi:hypothetical protein
MLAVDEVGCQRRDAAEVVAAGGEQDLDRRQVRRSLHGDLVVQDHPGQRDRVDQLGLGRLGRDRHRRAGVGAERLDDHLVHVPVRAVQIADRAQGLDALVAGLTDPDQDPRRERDAQLARLLGHLQAHRGALVRGAVVRHSLAAQTLAGRLEHQPEARVDRLEPRHLVLGQDAGVRVRNQAGVQRHPASVHEVVDRRGEAPGGELFAVAREHCLGAITQAEQRLDAADRARPLELGGDLRGRHRVRVRIFRRAAKGAVVADVAAQVGQRQEHLRRVGDPLAPAPVALRGRGCVHVAFSRALAAASRNAGRSPPPCTASAAPLT